MTTETTIDPTAIQQAAEQLRGAAASGKPVAPIRDLISAGGVDAAYAVQEINTRHALDSGRRLVGRKIGLTSLAVQRQLGVDQPDYGMLFSDMDVPEGIPISLDQVIAEQIGVQTRFPSLTLAVNTRTRSLSWTGTGVAIPPEDKAADVFRQLFFQGDAAQVAEQIRRLETGRSILDTLAEQAVELQRDLSAHDRERLDQYFTSVRNLERRLAVSRGWEDKPKPVVKAPVPVDPASPAAYMARIKVMYELAKLAFETDSTRAITLMLDGVSAPVLEIEGAKITDGYHNLSHHGKSESKRAQLRIIDEWHMKLLADLLTNLKATREAGETLLDRTMVLYGSNFGDANAHTCFNMPTILAGGGFRHGQHLAFSTERNYPLPNLFVSMLQRLGIEADKFASSTGTMRGLEVA